MQNMDKSQNHNAELKKPDMKIVHTMRFHLYTILETV